MNVRGRAKKGTDGSLLGSLPWTLAALVFALLPHLPFIPMWITAVFIACAAARWHIERRRWHLPGPLLRMALAVLCFLGVIGTYETISGVGPGSSLLAVMAALKLLETRRRRDQFVLLFLSIFLVMAALLREQYVWSLPYMLAAVAVTMTAWLQMAVTSAQPLRLAGRLTFRLMGYALPLMLVMWVFFPRIATPLWAVPIDTSSGVTGLSNELNPGDISSLSASDAVAFRVRFDGAVPEPQNRYWRGLVLTRFTGRKWTGNEPDLGGSNPPVVHLGDPVDYEITLEPSGQHWVFALDMPATWSLDQTHMGAQQQLQRSQKIDQRVIYRASSHIEYSAEPGQLLGRSRWTRYLPEESNPDTREFARRLRAETGSADEYIAAVMQLFNEQPFFYTLQPPALGADAVDEFLFSTRRGFCEHYASAFAVLMRAAGLPSRVVLGYQGGELNPMGDYLIVRQSDAHAWNEVWLGDRGWVRFDPTSAVAPERIEVGMSAARFDGIGEAWGFAVPSQLVHRLTLAWDMVNTRWNEWILAYGPENQASFMQWLGMDDPSMRNLLLTLVAITAALLGLLTIVLGLRFRPPQPDPVARIYKRFLKKSGVAPATGETPLAWLRRFGEARPGARRDAARITDLYLRARYSGETEHIETLRNAVRRFASARAA